MSITFAAIATADKLSPLGYAQVTVFTGAAQSLPTIPDGAQLAIIQAEGGEIRFRDDGTSPTAAIGMIVASGDSIQYPGDLAAFEFIETGAITAVNVAFYKYGF